MSLDVRRWELVALLAYSALLSIALLAPTSGTQSDVVEWVAGEWMTPTRAEFVCNALIVAPVSALGSLLWPRTTWRDWTAWAFVGASLVELTQGLALPHRTASYVDVVANTLGGLIGALVVLVARRLRSGPGGSD